MVRWVKPAWIVVESETRETCNANATPVFWACTRLEIMAPQRARTPFLGSRDSSAPKLEVHYMTCIDGPYIHAYWMHADSYIHMHTFIHACMYTFILTCIPACLQTYILTHVVICMHGYIVTWCLPSFLTFSLPYFLTSLLTYCLALHCIASHYITLFCGKVEEVSENCNNHLGSGRWERRQQGLASWFWSCCPWEIWTCDHWDKDFRTCTPTTIHHHLLPKYLSHLLPLSLQIVRDSLKSLLEKPVAQPCLVNSRIHG